jgi:hypothetical protein
MRDGQADPEQRQEQAMGLQLNGHRQEGLDGAVKRSCVVATGKNSSKLETRNSFTTLIASTPNRAMPLRTSMASMRSLGLTGAEALQQHQPQQPRPWRVL